MMLRQMPYFNYQRWIEFMTDALTKTQPPFIKMDHPVNDNEKSK